MEKFGNIFLGVCENRRAFKKLVKLKKKIPDRWKKFLLRRNNMLSKMNVFLIFTDLCPTLNVSNSSLEKLSYVEDLSVPVPSLFRALTTEPDRRKRWESFTYQDSKFSQSIKTDSYQMQNFVREYKDQISISRIYKKCYSFF